MRFFVASITDDRMGMANALAPVFGVEPEEALESGAVLVGSENEIIEQLQRRREEWGLSYVVVGDDNIDEFAPIVAKLAGHLDATYSRRSARGSTRAGARAARPRPA